MSTHTNAIPWETGNDEMERLALEECAKRQRIDHSVSVLILPADQCDLAFRFAQLGAVVTVADAPEKQQEIEGRILAAGLADMVSFQACTLPEPPTPGNPGRYDIIVLRRGLCFQSYQKSKPTIRRLMQQLRIGGKLFLSILGLHSELGDDYPGREQSIYERFAPLTEDVAKKYGISAPVCLYSERDVFLLLLESGASVLRTLTTTWGNVKAIAVRV